MSYADGIVDIILAQKTNEASLTDLIFGEVSAVKPYEVEVRQLEDELVIPDEHLIIGLMCRELKVRDASGVDTENYVFKDLEVGDEVIMIKCAKGQLYYVLEKVDEGS